MADHCDVVIIGSGHNGLVAAAYLARAGLSVEVLERNTVPGGAVTSEELTEPGYIHDTFSSWHPLFKLSAAFAELGEELGIEYCETPDATTANVRKDGAVTIAYRDAENTVEGFADERDRGAYLKEMGSFGETIPTVGQLFGVELFSTGAPKLGVQLARQLGLRRGLSFAADLVSSARGWFETRFEGTDVSDLYSPWALHTGLPPDSAGSGFQALAIAGSLHAVGLPVVKGGASNFVTAFERLIARHGGAVTTGVDVERIITRGGRAVGVVAGGREIHAARAVVANTTPTQLYGRLLPQGAAPAPAVAQGLKFRYSPRAGMQIHVALQEPLRWRDARLNDVPIVHISDGVGDVSLACAQAAAGLLPARPTVVVGQQTTIDPSRAPDGAGTMWIQLQQVPYAPAGDAAGEVDVDAAAGWTPELERAFTDRVLAKVEEHVENWPSAGLTVATLSPVEIERRNPNLVRGDIYSGDCELGQSYLWRPLPGFGAHATPVEGLYQCGASTYPGPGLNAASGRIVALKIIAGDGRLAKARQLLRGRR